MHETRHRMGGAHACRSRMRGAHACMSTIGWEGLMHAGVPGIE